MESEKLQLYAMAVGLPVTGSFLLALGNMVHEDLQAGRTPIVGQTYEYFGFQFDDKFLTFEILFFVGLFSWLLSLMFYNLLKMFGWDIILDNYATALTQWFVKPGNPINVKEIPNPF